METYVQYELAPLDPVLSAAFLVLISYLFYSVKLLGDLSIYPKDSTYCILKKKDKDLPVFDFIIIGSGTAGCVVANRLSQNQEWKVLLVEDGTYPTPATEVPSLHTKLANSTNTWTFLVEKNGNFCLGMTKCKLIRGHTLGGYSCVNNMHYTRGTPSDFDMWDSSAWNSSLVYKAFENLEKSQGHNTDVVYGTKGDIPLMNQDHCECDFVYDMLVKGYEHLGYQKIPKKTFLGYKEELLTIQDGRRQNSAKTFLSPMKCYHNFTLMTQTRAVEILTNNPTDRRAHAIELIHKGISRKIRVKKDIILTTGAINTAKLLMLSGIGPRRLLENNTISVLADLPVGKNLQIHVLVPIYVTIDCCQYHKADCEDNLLPRVESMYEYVMYRTGSHTNVGISDFTAYINTKGKRYPLPSVKNYHEYYRVNDSNFEQHVDDMEYIKPIRLSLLNANKQACILMFQVMLLNPLSTGEVILNGSHYMDDPIVKPNFFTDERNLDYDTTVTGVKHIINMLESDVFTSKNASFVRVDIPNCRNYKYCTDTYLKCYINHMAHPSSDISGTAPLGRLCDEDKVVKEDLEVKTVRGVRVVDASVMPDIVSNSIEGSVAAIAEMASEFIKQKWIKDYPVVYRFEEEREPEEEQENDNEEDEFDY